MGGSGASAWLSFKPGFTATSFRPVSMFYERENVFSIYWCNTNLSADQYGMYSLNTGTPSFEFKVPVGANGPGYFTEIVPTTKASGLAKPWALLANDIYVESAVVAPQKFDKVISLPASVTRIKTDAIMADPDSETDLWVAAAQRLYHVSQVGNPAPPNGTIKSNWNFASVSTSDRFQAILKVNGAIVVQFGNRVYRLSGTTFNRIGILNASATLTPQICTDGSTIYASDGTYFDSNANAWKSFIGTGQNLSGTNATRYQELKNYTNGSLPRGCVYGGNTVDLLGVTHLIRVSPVR